MERVIAAQAMRLEEHVAQLEVVAARIAALERSYLINRHRMAAKTPLDVLAQLFSPPVNRGYRQSQYSAE